MFVNVIPAGALEFVLFLTIVSAIVFVVRRVARRRAFLTSLDTSEDLPLLQTDFRSEVRIRRLFRDRDENVILVEGGMGNRTLTFCAADFVANAAIYEAAVKSSVAVALFALATLARGEPGNLSQMLAQETGADASFAFFPSGSRPNDYAIRGQIASHRASALDGDPIDVYTFEGTDGFDIEVATEINETAVPFACGDAIFGTARLYGYLPAANGVAEAATPLPPSGASRQ